MRCFRNAARHLAPGGRFVVEVGVPALRLLPPGQVAVPFDVSDRHVGFDTYDLVTQQGTSHHYRRETDGSIRYGAHHFRYVWPAECDLMAQLAGLELEQRVADWDGSPFTSDSERTSRSGASPEQTPSKGRRSVRWGENRTRRGENAMSRYVIRPDVAIRLARDDAVIRSEHELLAPTLLRSQVLSLLYEAVRERRDDPAGRRERPGLRAPAAAAAAR